MNGVLTTVLALLAGFTIMGYWRGFVRIVLSLVSMVLLLALVSFATPHITDYLKAHTGVYEDLAELCSGKIQQAMEQMLEQNPDHASGQSLEGQPEQGSGPDGAGQTVEPLDGFAMPKAWLEQILEKAEDALGQTAEKGGLYQHAGNYVADWILNGIVFWAVFVLLSIVLRFVIGLLDIVAKLPVINGANRLLGAAVGLIQGLLVVWLLMFLVSLACTSGIGGMIIENISKNAFLSFLYQHNLILYFFHFMFRI